MFVGIMTSYCGRHKANCTTTMCTRRGESELNNLHERGSRVFAICKSIQKVDYVSYSVTGLMSNVLIPSFAINSCLPPIFECHDV